MKVSYENIQKITCGVEFVEVCTEGIRFHRFTTEQENYYDGIKMCSPRQYGTSGVCLRFITDSKNLALTVEALGGLNKFFSLDVVVNGALLGVMTNGDGEHYPAFDEKTRAMIFDGVLGEYAKVFSLGDGEKQVEIFLPWTMPVLLKELCLDDGATILPVKRSKTYLAYGDSISYGACSFHPSAHYFHKMTAYFQAEGYCKAMGAEIFCPKLLQIDEPLQPDYVTVAYGTNEQYEEKLDFQKRCKEFFEILTKKYPTAKIYVVTPTWRSECEDEEYLASFKERERYITEVASAYAGVKCINGYDLIPHDAAYYADRPLHPNDAGFVHYTANLIKAIEEE